MSVPRVNIIATSEHTVCAQTLSDPTHVTAKLATDLTDVFVQVATA